MYVGAKATDLNIYKYVPVLLYEVEVVQLTLSWLSEDLHIPALLFLTYLPPLSYIFYFSTSTFL